MFNLFRRPAKPRAYSNDHFRQFPERVSKPLPPVVCSACFKFAHPPDIRCSACGKGPHAPKAYVIPWWNGDEARYLTTYRCDGCWKKSLSDTREHFLAHIHLDEDWQKFLEFWKRHGDLTTSPASPQSDRQKFGVALFDAIERGDLTLGA